MAWLFAVGQAMPVAEAARYLQPLATARAAGVESLLAQELERGGTLDLPRLLGPTNLVAWGNDLVQSAGVFAIAGREARPVGAIVLEYAARYQDGYHIPYTDAEQTRLTERLTQVHGAIEQAIDGEQVVQFAVILDEVGNPDASRDRFSSGVTGTPVHQALVALGSGSRTAYVSLEDVEALVVAAAESPSEQARYQLALGMLLRHTAEEVVSGRHVPADDDVEGFVTSAIRDAGKLERVKAQRAADDRWRLRLRDARQAYLQKKLSELPAQPAATPQPISAATEALIAKYAELASRGVEMLHRVATEAFGGLADGTLSRSEAALILTTTWKMDPGLLDAFITEANLTVLDMVRPAKPSTGGAAAQPSVSRPAVGRAVREVVRSELKLDVNYPLPEGLRLDGEPFGEELGVKLSNKIHLLLGLAEAFGIPQGTKRENFLRGLDGQRTLGQLITFVTENLSRFGGRLPSGETPTHTPDREWAEARTRGAQQRATPDHQAAIDAAVAVIWRGLEMGQLPPAAMGALLRSGAVAVYEQTLDAYATLIMAELGDWREETRQAIVQALREDTQLHELVHAALVGFEPSPQFREIIEAHRISIGEALHLIAQLFDDQNRESDFAGLLLDLHADRVGLALSLLQTLPADHPVRQVYELGQRGASRADQIAFLEPLLRESLPAQPSDIHIVDRPIPLTVLETLQEHFQEHFGTDVIVSFPFAGRADVRRTRTQITPEAYDVMLVSDVGLLRAIASEKLESGQTLRVVPVFGGLPAQPPGGGASTENDWDGPWTRIFVESGSIGSTLPMTPSAQLAFHLSRARDASSRSLFGAALNEARLALAIAPSSSEAGELVRTLLASQQPVQPTGSTSTHTPDPEWLADLIAGARQQETRTDGTAMALRYRWMGVNVAIRAVLPDGPDGAPAPMGSLERDAATGRWVPTVNDNAIKSYTTLIVADINDWTAPDTREAIEQALVEDTKLHERIHLAAKLVDVGEPFRTQAAEFGLTEEQAVHLVAQYLDDQGREGRFNNRLLDLRGEQLVSPQSLVTRRQAAEQLLKRLPLGPRIHPIRSVALLDARKISRAAQIAFLDAELAHVAEPAASATGPSVRKPVQQPELTQGDLLRAVESAPFYLWQNPRRSERPGHGVYVNYRVHGTNRQPWLTVTPNRDATPLDIVRRIVASPDTEIPSDVKAVFAPLLPPGAAAAHPRMPGVVGSILQAVEAIGEFPVDLEEYDRLPEEHGHVLENAAADVRKWTTGEIVIQVTPQVTVPDLKQALLQARKAGRLRPQELNVIVQECTRAGLTLDIGGGEPAQPSGGTLSDWEVDKESVRGFLREYFHGLTADLNPEMKLAEETHLYLDVGVFAFGQAHPQAPVVLSDGEMANFLIGEVNRVLSPLNIRAVFSSRNSGTTDMLILQQQQASDVFVEGRQDRGLALSQAPYERVLWPGDRYTVPQWTVEKHFHLGRLEDAKQFLTIVDILARLLLLKQAKATMEAEHYGRSVDELQVKLNRCPGIQLERSEVERLIEGNQEVFGKLRVTPPSIDVYDGDPQVIEAETREAVRQARQSAAGAGQGNGGTAAQGPGAPTSGAAVGAPLSRLETLDVIVGDGPPVASPHGVPSGHAQLVVSVPSKPPTIEEMVTRALRQRFTDPSMVIDVFDDGVEVRQGGQLVASYKPFWVRVGAEPQPITTRRAQVAPGDVVRLVPELEWSDLSHAAESAPFRLVLNPPRSVSAGRGVIVVYQEHAIGPPSLTVARGPDHTPLDAVLAIVARPDAEVPPAVKAVFKPLLGVPSGVLLAVPNPVQPPTSGAPGKGGESAETVQRQLAGFRQGDAEQQDFEFTPEQAELQHLADLESNQWSGEPSAHELSAWEAVRKARTPTRLNSGEPPTGGAAGQTFGQTVAPSLSSEAETLITRLLGDMASSLTQGREDAVRAILREVWVHPTHRASAVPQLAAHFKSFELNSANTLLVAHAFLARLPLDRAMTESSRGGLPAQPGQWQAFTEELIAQLRELGEAEGTVPHIWKLVGVEELARRHSLLPEDADAFLRSTGEFVNVLPMRDQIDGLTPQERRLMEAPPGMLFFNASLHVPGGDYESRLAAIATKGREYKPAQPDGAAPTGGNPASAEVMLSAAGRVEQPQLIVLEASVLTELSGPLAQRDLQTLFREKLAGGHSAFKFCLVVPQAADAAQAEEVVAKLFAEMPSASEGTVGLTRKDYLFVLPGQVKADKTLRLLEAAGAVNGVLGPKAWAQEMKANSEKPEAVRAIAIPEAAAGMIADIGQALHDLLDAVAADVTQRPLDPVVAARLKTANDEIPEAELYHVDPATEERALAYRRRMEAVHIGAIKG